MLVAKLRIATCESQPLPTNRTVPDTSFRPQPNPHCHCDCVLVICTTRCSRSVSALRHRRSRIKNHDTASRFDTHLIHAPRSLIDCRGSRWGSPCASGVLVWRRCASPCYPIRIFFRCSTRPRGPSTSSGVLVWRRRASPCCPISIFFWCCTRPRGPSTSSGVFLWRCTSWRGYIRGLGGGPGPCLWSPRNPGCICAAVQFWRSACCYSSPHSFFIWGRRSACSRGYTSPRVFIRGRGACGTSACIWIRRCTLPSRTIDRVQFRCCAGASSSRALFFRSRSRSCPHTRHATSSGSARV